MKFQLLLFLALAGPFYAVTFASPTGLPEDVVPVTEAAPETSPVESEPVVAEEAVPEATEVPVAAAEEEPAVVTDPPATEPPAAAAEEEVVTAAPEEVATEAAEVEDVAVTEAPVVETEAPEPAPTEALEEEEVVLTEAPAEETEVVTEPAAVPDVPVATEAAESALETGGQVLVEGGEDEGLSSGQVAGIVIGALLAVIIVIAVVIAVVRRMGKYSAPPKGKKPTKSKKDTVMVSPLKKKPAKQPERSKFWKV